MPDFFDPLDLKPDNVTDGFGLCLSGGGFRASLFHAGTLVALNHYGLLQKVDRFSSVSGGSITAGLLGLQWQSLNFESGVATDLGPKVIQPVLRFCRRRIDINAIGLGMLPGIRGGHRLARLYDKYLFEGATLQDLPDTPRFVINASNIGSGKLWRFSKAYAADYRVGMIDDPKFALAKAVAASSAFPPVLTPVVFDLRGLQVKETVGADLHRAPFAERAELTDGGVYDNLGTEAVWKRCRTVFVSNAGKPLGEMPKPVARFYRKALRANSMIHSQSEALRIRILRYLYQSGQRDGAYWALDEEMAAFPDQILGRSRADFQRAAKIRTRLNPFKPAEQKLLLELGFVATVHAIRQQYSDDYEIPDRLPEYDYG